MSALHAWLRALDEPAIAAWANKGLLRRGKGVLDQQDTAAWHVDEDRVEAVIEGHRQRLSGVGFEHLSCNCPAFGPCHHLCCFLLGLPALLPAGEAPGEAPTGDWLELDLPALEQALGAAVLRRARRWFAQGYEAELETGPGGLTGNLQDPEPATVRLLNAGGLAGSICSCKAGRCAHRALVVLQHRLAEGRELPPPPGNLEPYQSDCLAALDPWLESLVLQGIAGTTGTFLDQGEALATALRQADLPRPAAMLRGLVTRLRHDLERRGGDTPAQIRQTLAGLWLLTRGLRKNPLPRPLAELAGVHRRPYLQVRELTLQAVSVEVWDTLTGQRGFSVHFYVPERRGWLSWSESRGADQDPLWNPLLACQSAQLGGVSIKALRRQPHRLHTGWCSADGRLSGRDGTRLLPLDGAAAPIASSTCATLAETARTQRLEDPWAQPPRRIERIEIGDQARPVTDPIGQTWRLRISDRDGQPLYLQCELRGSEGIVARQLERGIAAGKRLRDLIGRIGMERGALVMLPIAARWRDEDDWKDLTR